jgi:hypothetical protein
VLLDVLVAAVLVLSSPAPDETPFQVVCEGALPFSRRELEGALWPRWRLLGRPLERPILVREHGDGRVTIDVGAGRREVGLQGQSGEAAARVVALLAVDLLAESAAAERGPPQVQAVREVSPGPGTTPSRYTASAQLLVPFVANRWTPGLEPTLGLERRVLSRASVGVSAGFTSLEAGTGASSLRLREIPVRAGVGYGGSWFEARLSGVLRPYFVTGLGAHQGVQWGAGVSATAYHQLTTHLALAVSGGLDALQNRSEFRVETQSVLSTQWLVPWFGAGLALRRKP